ncbi:hypothetical protein L198_00333 [Cryptococcus wingfieldii CBS 7118]|uniref:Zn(2)-C6 fungal-type domain-containing protein n=1 Tax=Cryptococcus wingfieldii CBS 7118 TaxID=1295528 RepID=A0A1E3K8P0_9TREE|nr:hypothetical protein L198_00333 [Cryptococcus wingfieldii CBS 7118]ODO08602.1 hypothetical protein L198_00333 [Cryptococcus wingfieldii CBS 7118]
MQQPNQHHGWQGHQPGGRPLDSTGWPSNDLSRQNDWPSQMAHIPARNPSEGGTKRKDVMGSSDLEIAATGAGAVGASSSTMPHQQGIAYISQDVRNEADVGGYYFESGADSYSENRGHSGTEGASSSGLYTGHLPKAQPTEPSLRRGMACKFCRRRKLRCSGERPICSSCVKYKQVCEYQRPPKIPRSQPAESSTSTGLSDFVHQPVIPCFQSAFSSQPFANTENVPSATPFHQDLPGPSSCAPASNIYQPDYTVTHRPFDISIINMPPSTLPFSPPDHSSIGSTSVFGAPVDPTSDIHFQQFPQYAAEPSSYSATRLSSSSPSSFLPQGPQGHSINTVLSDDFPSPTAPRNSYSGARPSLPMSQPAIPSNSCAPAMPAPTPDFSFVADNAFTAMPLVATQPYRSNTDFSSFTHSSASPRVTNIPSSTPSSTTLNAAVPPVGDAPAEYPAGASMRFVSDESDPVDNITERLGEFLFSHNESPVTTGDNTAAGSPEDRDAQKRRRLSKAKAGQGWAGSGPQKTSLLHNRVESDGLQDEHRNMLLDCFLEHVRLFFEMSIPRFRYRMTFLDKRRPHLTLLNAMYLWASRLSQAPNPVALEQHFYAEALRHLDAAAASNDRLVDAIRAAMLLSAYTYTNGRHHEARLAGRGNCCPTGAFKRLTSWCVYSIERCGALATGFPSSLNDGDIITPFGRPIDEIASQTVTSADDTSVRDLYRGHIPAHPQGDSPYVRWVKAVTVLERTSKLAFLDPDDDSEYSRVWTEYANLSSSPSSAPPASLPPSWLNQPKYRNPKDYNECSFALEQLRRELGVDGIFPVERKNRANNEGIELVFGSKIVLLHHHFASIEMLLHDINSIDADNSVAVSAAQRSVALFRHLPEISFFEVDAEIVLVWCMTAKLLIKELDRFARQGDPISCQSLGDDVDCIINELYRVGYVMHMSRTQGKAMEDLKKAALANLKQV